MNIKYALTIVCLFAVVTVTAAYAQDNWLVGNGNWSNAANWSMGLPGPSSDVVINSGYSNYTVTLDTSPSVNSLIVGGNSAQLTDAGATRNVSIASTLTTNFAGSLNLQGPASTVSVDGAFYDNGFFSMYGTGELANFEQLYLSTTYSVVHISPGDTLNLTNQPGGIIDAPANSSVEIWGAFNNVVAGVSGLANLTSIEGSVQFRHGQTTTITPLGGTLSLNPDTNPDCSGGGGCLTVSDGSTIDIIGNLRMNAGNLNIGSNMFGNGANTLNITGNLYNLGGHIFDGWVGDVLNVGGMVDNEVDFQLAAPSVVNIAGDLKNGGTFQSYNAIVSIAGNLNNRGGFFMNGFEGTVTATNISNSGEVIIGASETVRASGGGYTQSSGDTGVDGVLSSVTGVHINGGTLSGRGMVEGDIQMGGTLIPGYSSWVQ